MIVSRTVVAADPESTLTTEYVSLLTNGPIQGDPRRKNGRDEPKQKSDDTAKSVGVEVLRRMAKEGERTRVIGIHAEDCGCGRGCG